jgi:hypothetical protein
LKGLGVVVDYLLCIISFTCERTQLELLEIEGTSLAERGQCVSRCVHWIAGFEKGNVPRNHVQHTQIPYISLYLPI